MAEYIEREAAIAALPVAWDSAVDALRYAPAADVAPVVHGRWIMYAGKDTCSRCGAPALEADAHLRFYYCPNCGAKMDGGTEK